MDKINFLEETIRCLKNHGKAEEDVLWVGRGFCHDPNQQKYKTTWADFKSKADFYYDSGYGLDCIPVDLIIVGKDFWIERREHDGSEWWDFKSMSSEPEMTRALDLSDAYETAESLESIRRERKEACTAGVSMDDQIASESAMDEILFLAPLALSIEEE